MIKLYTSDLQFMRKMGTEFSSLKSLTPIFHKIESAKHPTRDFYEFELSEAELEIIDDFLTSLIGVGKDGEIDPTGRYSDKLIDVFKIYSE
ncbi:MAG TPA: hypothetical protein VF644_16470 [Pyrinomonadaceae bacterium]|jgi:hypothetical protein